ncbi:MAG TPA: hypothetical protein VNW50_11865 [Streptosporangiaceae bacterium]|jgi:hypothetical protein|nr:hypothetical protein [Streptosporangiaceae bacterium]
MKNQLGSRPPARLAAAVVAIALALVAGCTGPPPRQFSPMPPQGQQEKPGYTTILGPVSGRGSKTFTISARPGIAVWLGCIGQGTVWMTRPVAVGAICHSGNGFAGGLTQPTHYRHGQKLTVRIVGPATDRWEFRIDGAAWTG